MYTTHVRTYVCMLFVPNLNTLIARCLTLFDVLLDIVNMINNINLATKATSGSDLID